MRKIIIFLLILTIFSFSFVYAQENYITGKGTGEKTISTDIEVNNKPEKSLSQDEEASIKKVQDDEIAMAKEQNEGDELVKTQQEQKERENPSKPESNQKSKTGSQQSPGKEKSGDKKKDTKTNKNNTTKENVKKEDPVPAVKEEPKNIDGSPKIDAGNANNGSFKAKFLSDKKLKVMVVKGGEKYTYDLKGDNSYQSYPLQMGDGAYKVSIMENIGGNEYKYVLTVDVEVKSSNPNAKYLTSVQMINWNNSMAAIKKAKSLTNGLNDQQKLEKIYYFVINNIKYDSSITKLPSGYIPNINNTYSSKSGICYDFASIFAGMLRSVGVPTKLIKGNSSNVSGYHAWNEVYINGKWRIVDTSYDSQLKAAGHSTTIYKSGKVYSKSKEY